MIHLIGIFAIVVFILLVPLITIMNIITLFEHL